MVVFVVGGITRSEMRAAHKLSAKLGRLVLLGGTALDSPGTFLKRLGVRGLRRAPAWRTTHHLLLCHCDCSAPHVFAWVGRAPEGASIEKRSYLVTLD